MPKLTHRQWDEYKAIIKKCQTLEIEALSNRALQAQVADLQRQLQASYVNRGAIDGTSDARLVEQIKSLTAERDAAIKAACELFAFDEDSHKHWSEYTPATRELMIRQTDASIAAALAAAKDESHA